jgi:aminoglycoside phosphotransferase (APT) family kinase protein
VLRLYRDPQGGARADREVLALEAVRSAVEGVPEPRGRIEWAGRPGILMERLDGRPVLAELQRRPWRLWALATLTGRLHARLHAVRAPDGLPELRAVLAERILGESSIPEELRSASLAELARLPDGDMLCHGDFQPDNVMLCGSGPVVIDWAHATRGEADGDFARTALMMRLAPVPPGTPALIRRASGVGRGTFRRAYLRGYESERQHDPCMLRRWELVRAVERLADRIPEERARLLREIERLRRDPVTRSRSGAGSRSRWR